LIVACGDTLCWFFETLESRYLMRACSQGVFKGHERKSAAERGRGGMASVVRLAGVL